MPIWPWLVAPALMLLLIVGFSAGCLLLANRGGKVVAPPTPEEVAVVAEPPAPPPEDPPTEQPAAGPHDLPAVAAPPPAPSEEPPAAVVPLTPGHRPRPTPSPELAAVAPAPRPAASVAPLPQLSQTLLLTPTKEPSKEAPKATPEREAQYDRVVDRFILADVGRLRGLEARKAVLDLQALGPEAIPALVRGLNRSATLDASCPVMSISEKLGALLAKCNDMELLAQVRDDIGKGVGFTPYASYLTALKQSCADRVKKSQDTFKSRLPQLVAALKSKDPATRVKAANTLGLGGAAAKTAIPALVEALKDDDPLVSGYAARALAALGPSAVPALVKAARSAPDRPVRALAYQSLGESRPVNSEALRALADALADKEPAVRRLAADTLRKLGPEARTTAPDLIAALRAADADVRDGAGLALEAIDPDLRAALPALRRALAEPPAPVPVRASSQEMWCRTVAELAALAAGEPTGPVKPALRELSLRRGEAALIALALAAVSEDRETRALGREMLVKWLAGRPDDRMEDEAARRLKIARRLLDEGRQEAGQEEVRKLIRTHARTRAAEEARQLLAGAEG
jgi:HEAT repeat protein